MLGDLCRKLVAQGPAVLGVPGLAFVRDALLAEQEATTPLEIVVDGMSRRGVVMKPDKPFEVYVGQVDAFMAIQEAYTEEQAAM